MSKRKTLVENEIQRISDRATARQIEAGKRLNAALTGDLKSKQWLQEGISTSDVPALLQPSVNVLFLNEYAQYPIVWDEIAEDYNAPVTSINGSTTWGAFEFDDSLLEGDHDGDQFVGVGLPGVGEYDEYPAVSFVTRQLQAGGRKHGERIRFSWEAGLATGDFDWLPRAARFFARNAAEQEDVALAKQFVSTAGVVNSDFTGLTGNPALTLVGLEQAIAQANTATLGNGRPLMATSYRLVVTPALSQTAANILSITSVQEEQTIGTDTITFDRAARVGNVSATNFAMLAAVGNYTNPGTVDDFWFLVPQGTANPAFLEIFLQGYRTPLITIKDSGHFTLGGGAVPVREGNFEVDDVESRIRHWVGAAFLDEIPVFYSNSLGS